VDLSRNETNRFEIESKIGDRMAISYLWYENGKYRLDEVEDWFD
jgi:hypothetical protein